ncbi:hypothetical protein ASG11_05740 [Sphingomonas sp. Leaf357]|uniref:hypothetical protein n=1 Tax=Sphingomonas sp. Leaf357 TaxID=1736350 RepID=UPI0006F46DF9|nr:hypothetical protein [Sphingomonas sp. Leaf357]KQS03807.1 hypothetical protein ASG11_05740 [Sphingomonas sp. Leaf357]
MPIGKSCLASALILTAGAFPQYAAAQTVAGTSIVNTATMHYDVGGESNVVQSNQATILVAERLDVALARRGSGPITRTTTAIPLLLTNRGNGQEAFTLSTVDGTATPPTQFAIDVDGDGLYDPARDQLLPGATTPVLAPGATVQLLLLGDVAGQFDGVQNTITARAVTGYGAPGTVFAGKGDNTSDAVVGPTGAQAQIVVPTIVQSAQGALVKTQSVLAPDGSARAIRGAIITYTLTASVPAPSSGVRIDDPIPAGTSYVPGSLMLDAASLTDAGDGDAGVATATGISIALGALTDPAVHTVQFKVVIQ